MVDMDYEFLYYIITGKIYKKQIQVNGGVRNDVKKRGLRLLTKYWRKY